MKRDLFLPIDKIDLQNREIEQLDIIIISGDAYIDHPGFGAVIIARYLESKGYKVGFIAQPDINSDADFMKLGRPRLFFGISSGNMDSMINKYTAQKKIRSTDAYSPDGKTTLRPDRALIKYSQKIKKIYKDIPIVLGGIEASMRRIPHYDYWSDKLRNSVLFDAQADVIVYGMGEIQALKVAQAIEKGENFHSIPGTVAKLTKNDKLTEYKHLPDFTSKMTKEQFYRMSVEYEKYFRNKTLIQKCGSKLLIHNIPPKSPQTKQLDSFFDLPFKREPHPIYKGATLTAFEQIKTSITSHRGCFGGCNFCAIGYHQGKTIQSRSLDSIRKELDIITHKKYFQGTISDIGGPTANMYGMNCKLQISETCSRRSCIYPNICPHLNSSHKKVITLLKTARNTSKVKNVFVASGIRFDLALSDDKYIENITKEHTGGLLKLAPEHISEKVLKLMYKPSFDSYLDFIGKFRKFSLKYKRHQSVLPYIIVGHPGATLKDSIELTIYLKKNNIKLKQIQEFTPTPMTISTMMYFTGYDLNGKKVFVPKGRTIKLQKSLIQWYKKENKKYIIEALKKAHRMDLMNFFFEKRK